VKLPVQPLVYKSQIEQQRSGDIEREFLAVPKKNAAETITGDWDFGTSP